MFGKTLLTLDVVQGGVKTNSLLNFDQYGKFSNIMHETPVFLNIESYIYFIFETKEQLICNMNFN